MTRVLAVVVIAVILVAGAGASSLAVEHTDAGEHEELQDDLGDLQASFFDAAHLVPIIIAVGILVAGVAAFRGAV